MFALHHLRPASLSQDRDYCPKLRWRSLLSCRRVPTILNPVSAPMHYVIRQLTCPDHSILWDVLYYGRSSAAKDELTPRDVVHRPEIARYVEGWGRVGDTGFVAHDKKNRALLGAAWLRQPTDQSDASPELALAVKPEHRRHGIGTA